MKDLLRGELIRFTAEEPETLSRSEVRWQTDTEFHRLADIDPAMLVSSKRIQQRAEERIEKGFMPKRYAFYARTLADDQLIGFLVLWLDLVHNEVWVGLGIGERDFWGKGYGTDMMKLALRYAFTELNAHRVSLGLHSYNERAKRSYEKAGFRYEGTTREDARHGDVYTDGLWMGILREEWLAMQNGEGK
ncbi:MAG: GNAT family protein [Anaerolineales bacterium]